MTLRELRLPLLLLTGLLSVAAARATVTESFKQTYPLTADGVVNLESVNGSIEIVAWDKPEVSLEAEKRAKTDEDLKRIHLEIDAQPAKLSIKTKYDKKSVFGDDSIRGEVIYKLMVPAGASLQRIETVNTTVTITGIKGAMNVETVNGHVKVTGAAAVGKFETVNGTVHVEYAALPATGKISLECVNGSATVVVPKDGSFDLDAETVNGHVNCTLPITLAKSNGHHLRGHVGAGGASLHLESVNGSLSIETK